MPARGGMLIEIALALGVAIDEYRGYDKVVLFDYSRSLLREARQWLGDDSCFVYVAGQLVSDAICQWPV